MKMENTEVEWLDENGERVDGSVVDDLRETEMEGGVLE